MLSVLLEEDITNNILARNNETSWSYKHKAFDCSSIRTFTGNSRNVRFIIKCILTV